VVCVCACVVCDVRAVCVRCACGVCVRACGVRAGVCGACACVCQQSGQPHFDSAYVLSALPVLFSPFY
jgi:hypothetical protein